MTCFRTRTSGRVSTGARSMRTAIPRIPSAWWWRRQACRWRRKLHLFARRWTGSDMSDFDFGNGGADFGDIFEGLFGGGRAAAAAAFPTSPDAPLRNSAARVILSPAGVGCGRRDAGAPAHHASPMAKMIDLKLPAGVESGTQMKLAGKGQPGPGGAGRCHRHDQMSAITPSIPETATMCGSICQSASSRPSRAARSRCRRAPMAFPQ